MSAIDFVAPIFGLIWGVAIYILLKQIETRTLAAYFGFWRGNVCISVVDDSKYVELDKIGVPGLHS
jgi:hypothetical protein